MTNANCGKCQVPFAEQDVFVNCHLCKVPYHYTCGAVNLATARLINDPTKPTGNVFLCPICQPAVGSMQSDMNVMKAEIAELKAAAARGPTSPGYFDCADQQNPAQSGVASDPVVMSRLDSMEAKLDRFISASNPARLIDSVCRAACQAVFGASREMDEINSKRLNLVFLNVPVSEGVDDLQQVRDSLNSRTGLSGDMVVSAWRDAASVRPGMDKPPILKVKVTSVADKNKILDAAVQKAFSPFYVRKDLTYNERVMRRQAARLRASNGAFTSGVVPTMSANSVGGSNFVGGGGGSGRVFGGTGGTIGRAQVGSGESDCSASATSSSARVQPPIF
jgi:hypothetical protein